MTNRPDAVTWARTLTTSATCTEVGRRGPKKLKPLEPPPNPEVPAAPLSLPDAASRLGIRPVELAQAIREGRWP